MPKKAFDYSKTEIYKIIHCDPDKDFCYVGHTTNFTERKKRHTRCCNIESTKDHHHKVYQMIRENGGWDNFKMVFIEKWACESLREAEAREQYWIESLKPNMNDRCAQRSRKQYRLDNKEHLSDCEKARYEANKETILEKKKARYEANKKTILEKMKRPYTCDCGGKYTYSAKARHFRTQRHLDWLKCGTVCPDEE